MRIRAAVLTVALVGALLGGCAVEGDDKQKERKAGPPLTAKQIKSALLTREDLGKRFVVDRSHGDSDDENLGCLDKLDKLEKKAPEVLRERDIDYEAKTQVGVPRVSSYASTFRSVAAAKRTLDLVSRTMESCRKVSLLDDGVRLRFSLDTSTLALAHSAEQQVTMTASGSFTGRAGSIPFIFEFTLVRLGRHVIGVGMIDLAKSVQGARRELTGVAMDRLIAVIDGKKPPRPQAVLKDYPLASPKDLQPSL